MMDENSVSFSVLLDQTKAFDAGNQKILISKLLKLFNFSNSAGNLVFSYLLNTCQQVHLNGNIKLNNINSSVTLGPTLRPLLFCMYTSDLSDVLVDCHVHMYADDVIFYSSSK